MSSKKTCKTCLVEHDEEIHEATVNVHEWLRAKLQFDLAEPITEDFSPAA
jgi:hypothetical protein